MRRTAQLFPPDGGLSHKERDGIMSIFLDTVSDIARKKLPDNAGLSGALIFLKKNHFFPEKRFRPPVREGERLFLRQKEYGRNHQRVHKKIPAYQGGSHGGDRKNIFLHAVQVAPEKRSRVFRGRQPDGPSLLQL
ncbi:hypothetical protein [Desulfolithobacter dissulfuricans]|uniref:hypothetical protein n=1 Tax=Desulfolithobacter dissulfuricans TaxID=2795293 RepID=UPI002278E0DB|nr:hypothetical protein [Desulfolithobacter dissulfuricans]